MSPLSRVSGRDHAPGDSPVLCPIAISGLGFTFTAAVPPVGAVLLGIAGAIGIGYAASRR